MKKITLFTAFFGLVSALFVANADTPPQVINKFCASNTFFSQIQPGPNNINCTQPSYPGLANLPNFIDSLQIVGNNISFLNDSASPGNSQYYGTNSLGFKGYFTLPTNAITQLTGPVTAGPGSGSVVTSISSNVITNTNLSQAPPDTLKGNNTGSTANVSDLTVAQINTLLGDFLADGSVPLSGAVQQSNQATPSSPPAGSNKFYFKSDNSFYILNSSGIETKLQAATGAGTVTSVGLSAPGVIYNVTGSPVNTTGTLTLNLNTQLPNLIFSGPGSGGAATPTFRSLVGADLPTPSASTLGGVESYVAVAHQWINAVSTSGIHSSTQPAFSDISGQVTASQVPPTVGFNYLSSNTSVYGGTNSTLSFTGANNQVIGVGAGAALTSGHDNMFSGSSAGAATTVGNFLTFIGDQAGATGIDTGVDNTAIAYQAGKALTSGSDNTFIGYQAGVSVTTGANNVMIGSKISGTTGASNDVLIGLGVGVCSGCTGSTVVGYGAVATTPSGVNATILGANSNVAGQNSIAIGNTASIGGSATGSVAIGYQAAVTAANSVALGNGASTATANQIQLGNTSVTNVNTSGSFTGASLNVGTGAVTGGSHITTGTTSGAVTISSSTGTYNFNLPTSAGTAGGPLLSGGGGATAQSYGTIAGNTSKFGTVNGSLTNGHCVTIDSNGNFVDAGAACGTSTGSVTSVALSAPGVIYNVTGSPVTTTGTLTLNLNTQTANTGLFGPASGSAAAPTFRSLVLADLPVGSSNTVLIGNGIFAPSYSGAPTLSGNVTAAGFLAAGSGSGIISILPQAAAGTYNFNLPTTAGSAGQVLTSQGGGSNAMTWTSAGSGSVTSVSVVSANGLAGSVATSTTTPAITLSTTITGILQGNGTAISAATTGNLSDAGTDGIVVTGGTGAVLGSGTSIAQSAASASQNGYLTSTDWSTFNGKQAAGSYLTALTGDGTASGPGSAAFTLATVATGATVGSSTSIPTFTFNNKGLVTSASGNAVVAPAGTLSGTTLNSTVVNSSLTSVGTIVTGVWTGTTIAVANGGTGVTSVTTSPTATSFAGWDSNSALSATAFIPTGSTVPANGMYLPASNKIGFASNTLLHGSFDSVGRWSLSASSANSSSILSINPSATNNGLTGVTQRGVLADMTATSAATGNFFPFQSSNSTQAASFTLPIVGHFYVAGISAGAGSTITREAAFLSDVGTSAATNFAVLTDSQSFAAGSWFLKEEGTKPSSIAGALTVGASGSTLNPALTANGFSFNFEGTRSGSRVETYMSNLSNTASSDTSLNMETGGTSAGNVYVYMDIPGNQTWTMGIDNGNSQAFELSDSARSFSSVRFAVTAAGAVQIGKTSTTPQHILNTATGTNGSGVLTLTNAPAGVSGNPTGYIQMTINGGTHYVPYW